MRSNSGLLKRGLRDPEAFIGSIQHNSKRVVGRPIRTTITMILVYVMTVALVAFTMNPEEMQGLSDSEITISTLLPLLPPTGFLIVIGFAAVVGVPIGMIINGVRRDMRSSHRRRRRRDQH